MIKQNLLKLILFFSLILPPFCANAASTLGGTEAAGDACTTSGNSIFAGNPMRILTCNGTTWQDTIKWTGSQLSLGGSGFIPPKMTTTVRDAITSPATGSIIFNTTTNALNLYSSGAWGVLGSAGTDITSFPVFVGSYGGGGTQTLSAGGFNRIALNTVSIDTHNTWMPRITGGSCHQAKAVCIRSS